MRNLIGRLNARNQFDLDRIAAAWRAPITTTDKPAVVAQLFRTLTDLRAVRDAWAALDVDDRTLIATFATASAPMTLAELAAELRGEPAEVRDAAIRLYRSGWVAREGDNSELRVDEEPRLFVPPELAHAVRRVRSEIAAGDRSGAPLGQLLRELDLNELETSAQRWGVPVIAGLRSREELIEAILEVTAEPDGPVRSGTGLDREAVALLEAVRNGPPDGLPLETALQSTGIDPIAPGAQVRLRSILGRLERDLLVWHGYDWKGDRQLFMPAEIRSPRPAEPIAPPSAIALADSAPTPPYHFHLAWDLLSLLRALASPDPPGTRPGDAFPIAFQQRLNRRSWHKGRDLPPEGFLPFLTALALAEGLLVPEGTRGPMRVAGDIRRWRDRSFEDQDARLRWRWLTAIDWIEGADQSEIRVWGADWRSMRRTLLEALAALPDDGWRPLDLVANWIVSREPGLLGRAYTVAIGVGTDDDGAEARRIAARSVVMLTIRRALVWLGLVEVRIAAAHGSVMRVTPRGRAIATGKALNGENGVARLTIGADAVIALEEPTPLQVWSVSAFADLVELGPPARYRLSERSIERAIDAGFQTDQIEAFLRRQASEGIPAPVKALLERQQREHPIVHIEPATVIAPGSTVARSELLHLLRASGIEVEELGDQLIVRAGAATTEKLTSILKSGGLVVRDSSA